MVKSVFFSGVEGKFWGHVSIEKWFQIIISSDGNPIFGMQFFQNAHFFLAVPLRREGHLQFLPYNFQKIVIIRDFNL